MSALEWTDVDRRAADTARVLAVDAVEKAGNGHPGTAMSLAPAAYLLFQRVLRHDPARPDWHGRDRFVLSCGHSSLTLYIQLYLSGYGLELDDLKQLRQWGSRTPGHPEFGHTPGVETTTGPLGQGIATAAGMAMAARRERGLLDPDAAPGRSPFDRRVFVFCSDGDVQEGISHEAGALAGHQQLGNLIVLYDANQISIEDDTNVAMSEDVQARYAAYGWDVQTVDWRGDGGVYAEDVQALHAALEKAQADSERPSLIALRTIIGWPAPRKQNTGPIHGSKLGSEETAAVKEILGFDVERSFEVEPKVLEHSRRAVERGARLSRRWDADLQTWREQNPERSQLYDRLSAGLLPDGWTQDLPSFEADAKGIATRAASGKVLAALAPTLPELWGGSADLAGSNNTTMPGEPSFLPVEHATKMFPGHPYGRTLHFGIREHAMGAICNGVVLGGLTRPYCGTFLVFSDYMRPAVRLAALMKQPVVYVWTHDSIGLGEDGPTHQPVEQLAALRAIPGLDVVRPSDANETVWAWRAALERRDRPTALALTRQATPVLDRSRLAGPENTVRGAYVLSDVESPEAIVLASGSEVAVALAAAELLAAEGVAVRVVAAPCLEWFAEQDARYRREVLPPSIRARVSVEAGIAMPWRELIGDAGEAVSLEHFGASAPYERLFEEFGFTAEAVAQAVRRTLTTVREGEEER